MGVNGLQRHLCAARHVYLCILRGVYYVCTQQRSFWLQAPKLGKRVSVSVPTWSAVAGQYDCDDTGVWRAWHVLDNPFMSGSVCQESTQGCLVPSSTQGGVKGRGAVAHRAVKADSGAHALHVHAVRYEALRQHGRFRADAAGLVEGMCPGKHADRCLPASYWPEVAGLQLLDQAYRNDDRTALAFTL